VRAPTLQPQHRGCPVPRHKRRCSGQRTVLAQSLPLHGVSVRRLDLCRRKLKAIGPLPLSFAAISGSLHGPGLALVVSNRSRPLSSCQGGLEPYSWVVWRCRRSLYHLPSLEQGCTSNNNLGALCSGWYCSTFSNCGRSALVRYLLCGASRARRPAAFRRGNRIMGFRTAQTQRGKQSSRKACHNGLCGHQVIIPSIPVPGNPSSNP